MRCGDGAALLGFGSVGFEIRLLRVSGLTVRKIAFQMLIFTAVGFLRPFGSKPAELERQIRPSGELLVLRHDGADDGGYEHKIGISGKTRWTTC